MSRAAAATALALAGCAFEPGALDELRPCRSETDCPHLARPYCRAGYCVGTPGGSADAVRPDEDVPQARDAGSDVGGDARDAAEADAVVLPDAGPPPQATVQLLSSGEVGDPVLLDASQSAGRDLVFSWEVTGPSGAPAGVEETARGQARFLPMRAGSYEAVTVVTDAHGRRARSQPLEVRVEGFAVLALPTGGGANDVFTRDGGLVWVATDEGPLRLDRRAGAPSWLVYDEVDPPGTVAVVADPWYAWFVRTGTAGAALRIRRDELDVSRRVRHQPLSGIGAITAVTVSEGSDVWFGGTLGARRTLGQPEGSLGPILTLSGEREVLALARGTGGVWFGRATGVCLAPPPQATDLDCDALPVVPDPADGDVPDLILSLTQDGAGALWVGTAGQGVYRLADGRVEPVPLSAPGLAVEDLALTDLAADPSGDVWAVDASGLVRFYPATGDLRRFSEGSGLESVGVVRRVMVAATPGRQVWVAGSAGVAVLGG